MDSLTELLVIIIFALTLLLIIFERVHKTLAAMMGAGLALLIAIIPDSEGEVLIPDVEHLLELLEVDLLLVIIGITLMVGVARTTGIFDYIAIVVLKKSGDNQYKLLFALCILTLIFSALLDAYMAILLIGSITIVGCDALNINPKPFILGEAIFANLGGTMTRIASPPNLIIGGHFDIGFVEFFILTAPFVLITGILTYIFWVFLYRKDFSKKISRRNYEEILLIDERTVINNPRDFNIAIIVLILTVFSFAIASFLPFKIELGYIAIAGGFVMLGFIGESVDQALEKVEWSLVFFMIGLLTVVGVAEKVGILEILAAPIEFFFEINLLGGIIALQWINALASAVLDNIPVASVMTSVMDSLLENYPALQFNPFLVSVVIGTNLGGNITPIGSASTVQAVSSLNRQDNPQFRVTFLEFVKYGGIASILQLLIGSFYIIGLWLISN
ncbi:MAG: SLC13 family permease [Candidatus Hodarchaeales archaeon]|jgi:Na+/H+ antiporter NhaD/arsenite permease-like protein